MQNSLTKKITVGFILLASISSLVASPTLTSAFQVATPARLLTTPPESAPLPVTPQPDPISSSTASPPGKFDNYSKLRKALFGSSFARGSQLRIVINLLLHFVIMTIALCLCLFGIRILYYLPFFLFFFSTYYLGLFLNRFGQFHNLSDPLHNLGWTIFSFIVALALFVPLRKREQTLALNLGICLTIVIICILGLYVFQLESKRAAIGSFLASVFMGTAFTVLGLHNLDSLLIVGSSLLGSLIFITNLQIALEDQRMLTPDEQGLIYFVESPTLYFLSVMLLFGVGLFTQKFQEKRELLEMDRSIAEIRNNISLD